ncbi:MAG: DnaD domain protein [Dehalococcoidia bacterium]|nr:DnaD domain protein [Dehalococcoidia bacterium]
MSTPTGFPARMDYTPVPSPFLGVLLQSIDDLAELKCALRIFWHLHGKKGVLRCVTVQELLEDPVVAAALGEGGAPVAEGLQRVLVRLEERGVFLVAPRGLGGDRGVFLNTPQNRERVGAVGGVEAPVPTSVGTMGAPASGPDRRANIFQLYEENIGLLTPLIAEELKEAEATYPETWVREAFQEAVRSNKRSWRYIARILERWAQEGKEDGEPGRRPKEIGAKEYIRRYGLGRRA